MAAQWFRGPRGRAQVALAGVQAILPHRIIASAPSLPACRTRPSSFCLGSYGWLRPLHPPEESHYRQRTECLHIRLKFGWPLNARYTSVLHF